MSDDSIKTTYEDFLEKNGEMTYSNVGTSMMPILVQGKDLFTVRKKGSERCKKYDVVLYRRPPDKYILHRVIQVREHDYVIRGDNCIAKEYGITDGDILAVMVSYVHKGRKHDVNSFGFKLYSVFWCAVAPVRILYKRCRHFAGRIIKGMLRKNQ